MNDFQEYNVDEFAAVTFVGDVHGEYQKFKQAVQDAKKRNDFIVSLGDLVDYGNQPYECVSLMLELVMQGHGIMVRGNHERKLIKYLEQRKQGDIKVKMTHGLDRTAELLNDFTEQQYDNFQYQLQKLIDMSPMIGRIGNRFFAHGAIDSKFWNNFYINGKVRNIAYFGQTDGFRDDGYPNRIYDWVHDIPEEYEVLVGHDIRGNEPVNYKRATFVDTGSGKDGLLTAVRFEPYEIFQY